jgi:hypothetical protein
MSKKYIMLIATAMGILLIAIIIYPYLISAFELLQIYWKYENANQKRDIELDDVHKQLKDLPPHGMSSCRTHDSKGVYNSIELCFRKTHLKNSDMKHFQGLKGIIGLDLSQNKINDSGLAAIKDYKDLVYLQLAKTDITDEGIEQFTCLDNLVALDLSDTNITPRIARYLEKLPRLKIVYAIGTALDEVDRIIVDKNEMPDSWQNEWEHSIRDKISKMEK